MLELKDIVKVYPAGGNPVEALKGVSLAFRDSEFVSILGQSGCGKTTMLNIIGGLDQYTSGDLIINGKSTKEYKDRDWDGYRNHSIGFVFQSYNLIPHQNVLANVEIALSLSGVSKKERRERAAEALRKVGLGDQMKKRPSEMSGGQMQRVAIARAIVNNPDIILADEPTGALDTETSVQVMEILKELSKDKLVIMVTHNPELAEQYSTRIVRMLDGKITGDNNPIEEAELKELKDKHAANYNMDKKEQKAAAKATKKPSMSFFTAFGLSLKNLFTKKGRTILTSFAGSIGIIGIALIYSVSQGTNNFIDEVQEDTISAYPLQIQAQTVDLNSLLNTLMGKKEKEHEHPNDAVYQKNRMFEMMNSLNSIEVQENDLSAFKKYIEEQRHDENSKLHDALTGVQYGYDLNLLIYTKNIDGDIIHSDSQELLSSMMQQYYGTMFNIDVSGASNSQSAQMMTSSMTLWSELLPGRNGEPTNPVTESQYDVIYGRWPSNYDEIVLFVDENNELSDYTLYALGLKPEKEILDTMEAAMNGQIIEFQERKWSYEEICNLEFRSILPSACWSYDAATGLYTDLRETESGLTYLYDNALKIKVVGIVRPNPDAVSTSHNGTIGYTHQLTEYIITQSQNSDAIKAQLENKEIDITSGKPFKPEGAITTEADKAAYFKEYIKGLDEKGKANVYVKVMSIPSETMIQEYIDSTMGQLSREDIEKMMIASMPSEMNVDLDTVKGYFASMSDEDLKAMFASSLREKYLAEYAAKVENELQTKSDSELAASLTAAVETFDEAQCAGLYDTVVEFSTFTYDYNLIRLGCLDLDSPSSIRLYANTFENKDIIVDSIDEYNNTVDELLKIKYTDYVGILMSSVTTIINAITYVLIAFVAVSLIVSSIMIGVITLISVQERTKEIGILRALGASKKNVSSMFNAETVIIGFTSGLIGVVITYLLLIPINLIIHDLTGLNNLTAVLPIITAIILILISVLLTLIAGIIPSRSAAKKDPVVALRTE